MAKLRITFEVETVDLFDRLRALKGNVEPIGARVIGAMMTGEAGAADRIAMAIYGITITEVVKA